MALIVTTAHRSVRLHVQDFTPNSIFPLRQYSYQEQLSIYADGQEHEYILKHFKNLPSRHDATTWRGEWATFIAENLP